MQIKKIIILTLFALLYFTACSNNSSKNISENINTNTNEIKNNTYSNEIVRVGIYVYDYPMLYLSNDSIGGFDYDIMNEIAKVSDLKLEFVQKQFIELIPELMNSNLDIAIAGISITEERKKIVNFSKKYYSSGQSIIVNKDNNDIKTIDDLQGKNIGVILGTISDTIISKMDNINVVRFDSTGSVLLSLKVGKIDGVMIDEISCLNYIKYDDKLKLVPDIKFPAMDYGIAVRKEDTVLLEKINKGLDTIMSNGVYDELIKKHL